MGIADRKEREKEEKRQSILNAARTLFLEQGFEKTSIRNIADEIEHSPSTIYLYYKDKNEILFALHQVAFNKLIEEFGVITSVADPFERLVKMGHQYLKYAYENPELYDLMFMMQAPMDTLACRNEVWDDGKQAFNMLQILVQQCKEVGYFKTNDVENASLMIWSFMHGIVALHLKGRMSIFEECDCKTKIEQSFQLFVQLLKVAL